MRRESLAPARSPPPLALFAKSRLSKPFLFHIFRTLFQSSHPLHSIRFTLPLFSTTYALFCSSNFPIPCLFNLFRTLSPKHPGGGMRSLFPAHESRSLSHKSLPAFPYLIPSFCPYFAHAFYLLSFHILRRPLPPKSFRITFFQKTGGRGVRESRQTGRTSDRSDREDS